MLISHSNKFIFIHVYKVAGSSVNKALGVFCEKPTTMNKSLNKLKSIIGFEQLKTSTEFPFHITALQLKERIPNKIFQEYFKFAFVRNPWDWQVSLYHYALQTPLHHQHELTKSFGNFEKYLDWRVNEELHLQKDFITDENGKIIVDFVGKLESISIDFDTICSKVGLPKVKLPHSNKSQRNTFEKYYTPYTSKLIEKHFAPDIELFSYSKPRS